MMRKAGLSAGNWTNVGTENGTAFGLDTGVSLQPFYSSGPDAELTLVNGMYQPAIAMTVRRPHQAPAASRTGLHAQPAPTARHHLLHGLHQEANDLSNDLLPLQSSCQPGSISAQAASGHTPELGCRCG